MHRFECNIKPWGDVPTLTPCSGLDGHSAPLCSRAFIAPRRAVAGPYGHLAALAMMVVKLNGDAGPSEAAGAARSDHISAVHRRTPSSPSPLPSDLAISQQSTAGLPVRPPPHPDLLPSCPTQLDPSTVPVEGIFELGGGQTNL